jgi:prolyl 4-hydroxylase
MLTQQITPAVLQWIVAQAKAGHKPDAVLGAMLARGWQKDIANYAIERAKAGSLSEGAIPDPIPVPVPDLAEAPVRVPTPDRDVQVLGSMKHPRIVVFGGLLSHEECDEVAELARPRLTPSSTVDNWSGGHEHTHARTSDGGYFELGEFPVIERIEARIASLVRWPVSHGEGVQVLRYGPGHEYIPHDDYFDPTVPGGSVLLERGGQRVATLIIYLRSPEKGGATVFPESGFDVAPIKGNAVFFSYDRPHPISRVLHGGAPVIAGEKWIATKWLREKPIT